MRGPGKSPGPACVRYLIVFVPACSCTSFRYVPTYMLRGLTRELEETNRGVVAAVHIRQRPASLCVLRSVTGVPCPFCGGTTGAARLGAGDLRGSIAASPLALPMLLAWPWLGQVRPSRWAASRRVRWGAVVVVLGLVVLWFGLFGAVAARPVRISRRDHMSGDQPPPGYGFHINTQ